MNDYASANVVLRDPQSPLLNGEVPETVIDVTITAPGLHPAHMLNAAAVAADTGLRAVSRTHPAHRSAQCGRTFAHLSHDTTEGRCAGLESGDVETVDWEGTVEALRAALEVIADGGCLINASHDCFERGRPVTGPSPACNPCIAAKALAGEDLPGVDRG